MHMNVRSSTQILFGGALAAALLAVAACSGGSSAYGGGVMNPAPSSQPSPVPPSSPAIPTTPPAPTPTPMLLALGHVVGTQFFPSGNTASGGTGQVVDGFSCGVMVQTFHIHAHITIYHNGTQIALPVGMGIVNPVLVNNGTYTNAGTCFYNLHMHDMSGIIHMEAPAQTAFTLGEVFDIWGQPLSANNVAGFTGPTLFYVGTTSTSVPAIYSGDPRAIVLTNHEQITLEVGGPYIYPLNYNWSY